MFKFNVLPGLYFTDAYGIEGNPKNATNAVTLNSGASAGSFTSNATITVTGYNFTALTLTGDSLTISITGGSIKNASNDLQTTSPNLPKDTVLTLDATGTLSGGGASGTVTLAGIIVVTSTGHAIGSSLTITGSGNSNGVSGSLNLQDASDKTHVTISGTTSTLTINKVAYTVLKPTATQNTLKIGASKSDPRDPQSATGAPGLNKEDSFTKYWHLLPPNNI